MAVAAGAPFSPLEEDAALAALARQCWYIVAAGVEGAGDANMVIRVVLDELTTIDYLARVRLAR
jgi:hypothetical protein